MEFLESGYPPLQVWEPRGCKAGDGLICHPKSWKAVLSRKPVSGSGKAMPSPVSTLNYKNDCHIVPGAFSCTLRKLCHAWGPTSPNNESWISLMPGGVVFPSYISSACWLQCKYINSQQLQGTRSSFGGAACTLAQSSRIPALVNLHPCWCGDFYDMANFQLLQ